MSHLIIALLLAGCSSRREVARPAEPPVAYVESAGATIAYQVFGEGPPLLVLSGGFGSDSRGFEGLARMLASRHQVILPDRRGTGRSELDEVTADTITMDRMVEDLEAVRNDLGVTAWSVLGQSFGGMLASHYTARHPSVVQRLVLSSSSGVDMALFDTDARGHVKDRLDAEDRAEIERLEAAYRAGDQSPALFERFSTVLSRAYVYDDANSGWVARRLRSSDVELGRLVTEDLRRTGFDSKPALASFPRPVLVVQGRQDVMPLEISERAVAVFPDARLVVLEECGHYGWLDQEEAYLATVLGFLATSHGSRAQRMPQR